jgi:hypothetical protein
MVDAVPKRKNRRRRRRGQGDCAWGGILRARRRSRLSWKVLHGLKDARVTG